MMSVCWFLLYNITVGVVLDRLSNVLLLDLLCVGEVDLLSSVSRKNQIFVAKINGHLEYTPMCSV